MAPAGQRRSIRQRLALAIVAFAGACVGVSLLLAYLGAVLSHRQELDSAILEQASELLEDHEARGHEGLLAEVTRRSRESGSQGWLYAYWSVDSRDLLGGNMDPPRGAEETRGLRVYSTGDTTVLAVAYLLPGGRAVLVGHDMSRQVLFERRMVIASMAAGAAVILLSVGGGLWLSRNLLARVEQMNRTVLSILHGRKSERVSSAGNADEFDELARHFNELLDENERLISQVREVTNDIAHDLRTPLSRVRRELEGALARPRSAAEDAEVLQRVLDATNSLLDTFQALLSIAQIEGGAVREAMVPLDLAQLARDAVELYRPAAEEAGLKIHLDAQAGVRVRAHRQLLSQALSNLIDNAVKFSPAPSTLEVGVCASPTGVELRVADHGPGIPAAEREHVLQRFVRLDTARRTPGTGLGLSLVAAVVALHGASLHLTDNAPGLVATIRFEGSDPG
jgi:signal transduction histidine kinase